MNIARPTAITAGHAVTDFDCGVEALNLYLTRFALQNHSAGLAKTYVCSATDSPKVLGYYSVCAGSIERAAAPLRLAKGAPNLPIPVILLARLAVDRSMQKKGIGDALLQDALRRAVAASDIVGVRAVLVHAKGEQAASFYRQYDFEPSPTDPFHLAILIKDILKQLRSNQ